MKNKYDTSVVFLYAIGKEHLLPLEFRKNIPYSTISTWRKINYDKYLGHEFRYFFDDSFDKAVMADQYFQLKKTMMAFARSWITLSGTIPSIIKSASKNKALQTDIINAVNYMREHIGLENALKLVALSKSLYYQWVLEARFECFDSFTYLCVRRHPHQLLLTEILGIKKLLTNPVLDHWPIISIAANALRKKNL